jgi:hypothetical protein
MLTLEKKITVSSDAARETWNSGIGRRSETILSPEVFVAVYIPRYPSTVHKGSIPSPEIYTTISDERGESIFYFARDRQIFAVVSFKCEKKRTSEGRLYYEIIPSVTDLEMKRSPLRPIGCKVNEKDPISTAARLYVLDEIEPVVSKTSRLV